MGRAGWLVALALALIGVSAGLQLLRRRTEPLPCDPSQLQGVREGGDADGALVARCGIDGGQALPAAWQRTVGQKLRLNHATEAELALLHGVGPKLAHALVEARGDAGYTSWDEVDRVSGVGPAKLEELRRSSSLEP